MHNGMGEISKVPKLSHQHKEHAFTSDMQDLCDKVNFDHHLLKNDLNFFNEAYVKYKDTMRK